MRARGQGCQESQGWADVRLDDVSGGLIARVLRPGEPASLRLGICYEPAAAGTNVGDAELVRLRFDVRSGARGATAADLPGVVKAVRENGADAVAETIAGQLEAVVLDKAWDLWRVAGQVELADAAGDVASLEDTIHEIAVGEPSDQLMSGLGLPGTDFLGSIIEHVPISFIDRRLGTVKLAIEVAGIAVSVIAGAPLLACACFKALIHDTVHRLLVSAIKTWILGGHSDAPDTDQESPRDCPADPVLRLADSPAAAAVHGMPDETSAPHPSQITTLPPTSALSVPAEAAPMPAVQIAARAVHPATTPLRDAAIALASRSAASAGTAERAQRRISGGRPGTRDGKEAIASSRRLIHSGPGAATATAAELKALTFVRLRICYQMQYPAAIGDPSRPVLLTHLVIARDSRHFTVPEQSLQIGQAHASGRDTAADLIARQFGRAATTRAWQIRSTASGDCFVADAPSVAALLTILSRTLMGVRPDSENEPLIV